jgi:hypothetical protein
VSLKDDLVCLVRAASEIPKFALIGITKNKKSTTLETTSTTVNAIFAPELTRMEQLPDESTKKLAPTKAKIITKRKLAENSVVIPKVNPPQKLELRGQAMKLREAFVPRNAVVESLLSIYPNSFPTDKQPHRKPEFGPVK